MATPAQEKSDVQEEDQTNWEEHNSGDDTARTVPHDNVVVPPRTASKYYVRDDNGEHDQRTINKAKDIRCC